MYNHVWFYEVLRVEPRASCMLHRHSDNRATASDRSGLVRSRQERPTRRM